MLVFANDIIQYSLKDGCLHYIAFDFPYCCCYIALFTWVMQQGKEYWKQSWKYHSAWVELTLATVYQRTVI